MDESDASGLDPHSTEKRVLMAMRKTLARVVRDLTPSSRSESYPLSDATVEDIKMCFDLIAARERELLAQAGIQNQERPRFIDEPATAHVVSLESLRKSRSPT